MSLSIIATVSPSSIPSCALSSKSLLSTRTSHLYVTLNSDSSSSFFFACSSNFFLSSMSSKMYVAKICSLLPLTYLPNCSFAFVFSTYFFPLLTFDMSILLPYPPFSVSSPFPYGYSAVQNSVLSIVLDIESMSLSYVNLFPLSCPLCFRSSFAVVAGLC